MTKHLDGEASFSSQSQYSHVPGGADLSITVDMTYTDLENLVDELNPSTAMALAKNILSGNASAIGELVSDLSASDQMDIGYEILDNMTPGERDDLMGEFSEHHLERSIVRNEINEMGK